MNTNALVRVLGVVAVTAGFAAAGPLQDTCDSVIGVVPLLSAVATSGTVGDYGISCNNQLNQGHLTINVQFTMTVPVLNTGGWTLTQGANTYTGSLFTPTSVRFTGVDYDSTQPALSFDFSGMQVNPSLQAHGFAYQEFVAFTGPTVPSLNSSSLIVAFNDSAPEPGTWVLLGSGMLVALCVGKRRLAANRRE